MRSLVACLFLVACATSSASPAQRVAGCWIDRNDDGTSMTMRWLPDAQHSGALQGATLLYTAAQTPTGENFTLTPGGDAWTLCQVSAPGAPCWRVAQGEGGSLEGGRAFIDAHRDRLRISVMGAGDERVIFQGRRDGCD